MTITMKALDKGLLNQLGVELGPNNTPPWFQYQLIIATE